MTQKHRIWKHKNKVYKWIDSYYLIPNSSGDVYEIVKGKIKYLAKMSTSTIKFHGNLVGKDWCP